MKKKIRFNSSEMKNDRKRKYLYVRQCEVKKMSGWSKRQWRNEIHGEFWKIREIIDLQKINEETSYEWLQKWSNRQW